MKQGLGIRGYTLVEVMIVLAISSGLLVAAMATISGQRQKTEFSQAIREIDSQIQDVINDVATGYYANPGNFSCSIGPDERPRLQDGGDSQGANKDCVFIGRVMQFGAAGSSFEGFNIFNVVGLREGSINRNSVSFEQAIPTAMAPGSGLTASYPDATERKQLQYGMRVVSMRVGNQAIGAVGFFGSLTPGASTGSNLVSGSQTVDLVPIPATSLNASTVSTVNAINALDRAAVTFNPTTGVVLCFQSGGSNEYGEITIGSNARRLTTNREIKRGSCQ